MIILHEPKNKSRYMAVDNCQLNLWLQNHGFHPRYMYDKKLYYERDEKLIIYVSYWEKEVREVDKDL
jgi:hypothetical protein